MWPLVVLKTVDIITVPSCDWTMNPDMVLDSSLAQISPWYQLAMQLT